MGRIRTIKPEFPQSETIGRLSRDARLLFIQLWTFVDDSGRARAASRMLASALYPYDDDAPKLMDRWLGELEREGCIRRYVVDGNSYLDIPNWLKHQKIDRPSASRFPGFDEGSRALDEPSTTDLGPRTRDLGPRTVDLPYGRTADAAASGGVSKATPPPEPPNLKTQLFGECLQWLGRVAGKNPNSMRSLVGGWIRDHGEEQTLAAFIRAQRDGPVEPVAWITAALQSQKGVLNGNQRRKSSAESPEDRERAIRAEVFAGAFGDVAGGGRADCGGDGPASGRDPAEAARVVGGGRA